MSFTIFQNKKPSFQAIKKRGSKSRKIDIFPNRLTHGFGPKMIIFQPFFQAIQSRKMSLTIFYNKKTPFQAIKKEVQKSPKIDIFSKGLIHGFGLKMDIFPTFFFQAIQTRKTSFTIFQKEKTHFQAIIDSFSKGLIHGIGLKMAIFPTFFFRQYRPGKRLLRYSRTKKHLFSL